MGPDLNKKMYLGACAVLVLTVLWFASAVKSTVSSSAPAEHVGGLFFPLVLMLVAVLVLKATKKKNYYCHDCGQFLGTSWTHLVTPCQRCACNVYTEHFTGTGQTTRTQNR